MGILNWWKRSSARPSDAEIAQALDRLVPPLKAPDDAELAEVWIRDGYGTRVRARHILFRLPPGATTADRAKLLQVAATVADRVERGEDFAELARKFTMEPGGRDRSGDLGVFERGRMVKAFEAAAFSLQPGKVSGLVETPFGYHLVKVEERSEVAMQDRAAFRQVFMRGERQKAIRTYLECLQIRASLQIHTDAEMLLREMAKRPGKRPGFWAAKRPLVRFRGGTLTVGEMAELLSHANASQLEQIANASNFSLNAFLADQASRHLIWAEATLTFSKAQHSRGWWTTAAPRLVEAAPGARLLWFADFFYSRKNLEEVLQPTILDMRDEYNRALSDCRAAKAQWVRIRGTWDFACAAASLTAASIGSVLIGVWRMVRGA